MAQNNYYKPNYTTQRELIMQQIQVCQRVISMFEAAPTTIDAKIGVYDFTTSAHQGKKVALSVLVLEKLCRQILPPKAIPTNQVDENGNQIYKLTPFFEATKQLRERAFGDFEKAENQLYLSEASKVQFRGIYYIIEYFGEMIAAIFSLKQFNDIRYESSAETLMQQETGGDPLLDENQLFE